MPLANAPYSSRGKYCMVLVWVAAKAIKALELVVFLLHLWPQAGQEASEHEIQILQINISKHMRGDLIIFALLFYIVGPATDFE